MSFPVRQIWLFVSSYVFQWQYVWLVSCCWNVWPVKSRKNGRVFVSATMAAVHFSPELLSEKPVTLLMINASVCWAVSELQQPLNLDSQCSFRPTTSGLQPQPVLQCNKSMAVSLHCGQRLFQSQVPMQKAHLKLKVMLVQQQVRSPPIVRMGSAERVMLCYWRGFGMTQITICMWTTRHPNAM